MATKTPPSSSTPLPTPPTSPQPSSSTAQAPRTSFLDLPPEIRLEVYTHLLRLPPIISTASFSSLTSLPKVTASILLTSRQINNEATSILYTTNTFIAHPSLLADFPRLRPWYPPVCCPTILPRICRFHLTVRLDCDLPFDRRQAAKAFSGAEELHVDATQSVFLGVGCANLRVLEDVRDVKVVTIRGSTTGMEAYVKWLTARMMSAADEVGEQFVPPDGDFEASLDIVY